MDREAASFRKMTAKLDRTTFTAVIDDRSTESGAIWLMRSGGKVECRGEVTGPDARSIGFRDNKAEIYYPKMKTVQIYDLGKEKSLVDQFLLVGFGSSGKELLKSYTVKAVGEETVGGQKTTHLELTPRSAKVQEQITRIDLWIPLNAGHPVKQKFLQPGGNYYDVVYTDVKVNPDIPDSAFKLNLPAGVKREYPSK
jgi:outer membrane lipoprotein-sorting protein